LFGELEEGDEEKIAEEGGASSADPPEDAVCSTV
jgi:hypothetical protein